MKHNARTKILALPQGQEQETMRKIIDIINKTRST